MRTIYLYFQKDQIGDQIRNKISYKLISIILYYIIMDYNTVNYSFISPPPQKHNRTRLILFDGEGMWGRRQGMEINEWMQKFLRRIAILLLYYVFLIRLTFKSLCHSSSINQRYCLINNAEIVYKYQNYIWFKEAKSKL